MAQLAVPLQIIGTAFSALQALNQGKAAKQAADYNAKVLEQRAGQERAAAQREAQADRRKLGLMQSRAQAVGAASGGFDPLTGGMAESIGDLEAEGELRALTSLFRGEEAARGAEASAALQRWQGKQAKKSAFGKAAGTLFSGLSPMFEKYGDKWFGLEDDVPPAPLPKPRY